MKTVATTHVRAMFEDDATGRDEGAADPQQVDPEQEISDDAAGAQEEE